MSLGPPFESSRVPTPNRGRLRPTQSPHSSRMGEEAYDPGMRLRTLGGLTLEGSTFVRPESLLLLCYLSLEGPRSRSELTELSWGGARAPGDSLEVAIDELTKESPELIEADGDEVRTGIACDANDFLTSLHAGRPNEALDTYRGPFLEGFDLPLGEELAGWVNTLRAFLAGRMRYTLLQLGEQAAAQGQFEVATKHAEAAYLLPGAPDPVPEDFQRFYNLLFLQAGDNPLAAEVRKEAEWYGITVIEQLEAARTEVQAASPAELALRHNLPSRGSSFVGRDPELMEIEELLANPECRLLTLHGAGGVGKSRLALQAAHAQLGNERFRDGIFLVVLDALTTPELIPSSIAEALRIDLPAREEPLAQLKRYVGTKSILLMLDNFEPHLEAASLPVELLRACPNLRMLVTSRERLNLEEEWVLPLEGLPLPTADIDPGDARHYGSVQLFLNRAKRARLDFSAPTEDLPQVVRICELVEGSPLGIELAAVWVKLMSPEEIVREIEQNLDFLTSSTRDVDERQRSIRAVFEHSWRLLTPREQEVFGKLSVFRGGFRREAASEVTGGTLPVLMSLLDKSLLKAENDRYESHSLVRQYSAEKLAEQPQERETTETKHGRHYLRFLEGCVGLDDELARLDVELDNVLVAMERASQRGDGQLLVDFMRLLAVDGSYHSARGYSPGSLELLKLAVVAARSLGEPEAAHRLLSKLGDAYRFSRGDLDLALEAYQESLDLVGPLGDPHRRAVLLSVIGQTRFERGDEDADAYLEEGYDLAKEHDDGLALSHVLQHMGYQAGARDDWKGARRYFSESLEVVEGLALEEPQQVGRSEVEGVLFAALLNLGEVDRLLGRFEESLVLRKRALELAEDRNNLGQKALAV